MLLLLACTAADIDLVGDSGPPAIVAAPAFDPMSGLAWTFESDAGNTARILDSNGATVREGVGTQGWDGRDREGDLVATGTYTVEVGEATTTLAVVRAGLVDARAGDDGGASALRVPLYWHRAGTAQVATEPFSAVSSIDRDGKPTSLPAVGATLGLPATGEGEPLAYRWDSRPILTLAFGEQSELGAANLDEGELSVVAEGWTVIDGSPASGTVTLQRDAAIGSTLGVSEETLSLQVVSTGASGATYPVNTLAVPMRVYRVHDGPTWYEEGDIYRPWVAAIDPALRAIEGTAPTREAALDALVSWVYEDLGLEYDTRYGASAYTTYVRNDWERANFDMSAFIDLRYGTTVNCTDCAGIIVAYGNMIGALAEYAIIGWNFDLNYILAIGGDDYTHCPFGNGGCSFSYHAVTVSETLGAVWDATLALDGDDDPGSEPNALMMVQAVAPSEYLERLSPDRTSYDYQSQGTMQ